jgi:hypothetical protein
LAHILDFERKFTFGEVILKSRFFP